jgi:hypothetical protein
MPSNIEFTIDIKTCDRNDKSQKWIFQNVNSNPDIVENNPEISSEELQEWGIEENLHNKLGKGILNTRKREYCMGFN